MNYLKIVLILFILGNIFLQSCYYDVAEELYPSCDTTNVSYSADIAPLIASKCITCHKTETSIGKLSLSGHNNVQVVANNGKLFGAVNHSPGFDKMPYGQPKLPACQINKIKAWIDNGALNN